LSEIEQFSAELLTI